MSTGREKGKRRTPNWAWGEWSVVARDKAGRPLVGHTSGAPGGRHIYNLPEDERFGHFSMASGEIVVWLVTAIGSGILGNAAYDSLKQAIRQARKIHKSFKRAVRSSRLPDELLQPLRIQ